ncbi:hypothetical protein MASR1M90_20770 [Desulfovibrionales bacterium]
MRALLMVTALLLLTVSCSKEVQSVEADSPGEPLVLEEKANVELRLGDVDLSKYTDQERGIWKEARMRGMQAVCNTILEKDITLIPSSGFSSLDAEGRYTEYGQLTQTRALETGDFVQNFEVMVRFVGDASLSGQVAMLKEGRYVAGMTDVAYGVFFQRQPSKLPVFAAVAEPVKELGHGLYRLIGIVEVQHVMSDTVALPTEQGGTGKLCSLEVVGSSKEIEAGDLLFLLTVNVTAQESDIEEMAESLPEIPAQLETVIVQPAPNDTVPEPAESK